MHIIATKKTAAENSELLRSRDQTTFVLQGL